jgi:hypothetical protein
MAYKQLHPSRGGAYWFAFRNTRIQYEGKVKSKGTFQAKDMYCKYTETKLVILFNVNPLEFNAPVPALQTKVF